MKIEHLKMIGLGTKGSDGIEEGIHLRWSFNDKLGFPDCFKLYRRESDLKNKYVFPVVSAGVQVLTLPYTFQLRQNANFEFRIDSAKIGDQEVDSIALQYETLEDGSTIGVIPIDGEVTILFSKAVSRIELRFLLDSNSQFKIKTLSEEGVYYPYDVQGNVTGLQNISFDASNATGIMLRGAAIKLAYLAGWICRREGRLEADQRALRMRITRQSKGNALHRGCLSPIYRKRPGHCSV